MNVPWWRLGGPLLAAGILLAALAGARAETGTLEIKRLEPRQPFRGGTLPLEYLYHSVRPQHFYMQIMEKREDQQGNSADEFKRLVKKEPEKYNSKHPLLGVAKLGGQQYCFVLDAKEPNSSGYGLFYFDRNLNGDLTDDEPIEAEKSPGRMPTGYSQANFPRIDLTIEAGGEKFDYAFYFRAYANTQRKDHKYVSASLTAAAYREGEMSVGGKKRHIVLLDYDSSGRFDDVMKIRDSVRTADGRVYVQPGDMLLVDPEANPAGSQLYRITSNDFQHPVSKWANIGGRFFEVKITPAGDRITLTPSEAAAGEITNPNKNFRAMVYNTDGVFLKIDGSKNKPVALPEGFWRLLDYTIDLTESATAAKEKQQGAEKDEKSLLEVLVEAFAGTRPDTSRPRYTIVSASGTADYEPVRVLEGKTVKLPFGPPYTPVVTVSSMASEKARLALTIVGSADELCTNLMVNGKRPDKPKFVITTKDGEEVTSGSFEYG